MNAMNVNRNLTQGLVALVVCALLGACNTLESTAEVRAEKERWNSSNEPSNFTGIELNTKLDALPTSGRTDREIWPSSYWPMHKDSINARWKADELSPAEKYDQAFNGWVPPEGFMDLKPYKGGSNCADFDKSYYEQLGPLASLISGHMGNGDARDGVDSDGDGEIDECDDRDGVETWFGLCHAWVPAAMLEDRPLRSVTHNGVTFHTGDIEALIIAAYNRAGADMIGGRCNDKEVKRDEQGRAEDVRCRDTNPGTMHVIMTNYLGINKTAFAEDRTYDYEVWNQPIVAYDVSQLDEITLEEAISEVGLTGDSYVHNADARFFYKVAASMTYITESSESDVPAENSRYERTDRYTYILELDEDRRIIGGEWTGSSRSKHPDFLWNPRRAYRSSVQHLDLEQVRMLIRKSREPVEPEPTTSAPAEPVSFSVTPGVEIPDNDVAGVGVELTVGSGLSGSVDVTVDIAHPSAVDVMVGLISPSGEKWTIVAQGSSRGRNINTTITLDPAPVGDLGGTWRLNVSDRLSADVGTVDGFTIKVTPAE